MRNSLNQIAVLRTAALLAMLIVATSTCESSCENRDFTAVDSLPIDLKPGEEVETEAFNPYSGRMTVDFAVTNASDLPFELVLSAEDIQSSHVNDDAGVPDAGESVIPERRLALVPSQRSSGSFGEDELASGIGVRLVTACVGSRPCLGSLEYTVLVTQHDCRSDSQCSSGTQCDSSIGRCVGAPCASDSDCPSGEICDSLAGDEGRCSKVGVICSISDVSRRAADPSGLAMVAALLAVGVALRRRW